MDNDMGRAVIRITRRTEQFDTSPRDQTHEYVNRTDNNTTVLVAAMLVVAAIIVAGMVIMATVAHQRSAKAPTKAPVNAPSVAPAPIAVTEKKQEIREGSTEIQVQKSSWAHGFYRAQGVRTYADGTQVPFFEERSW